MSQLLSKSNENRQAAQLLIGHEIYAPGVHCSYYRCVQYMKHLALRKYNMSEEGMEGDRSRQGFKGTHQYLINLIAGKIREINKVDVVDFKRKIEGLKKLRVQSDYNDESVSVDISMAAFDTSEEINQYLKANLA